MIRVQSGSICVDWIWCFHVNRKLRCAGAPCWSWARTGWGQTRSQKATVGGGEGHFTCDSLAFPNVHTRMCHLTGGHSLHEAGDCELRIKWFASVRIADTNTKGSQQQTDKLKLVAVMRHGCIILSFPRHFILHKWSEKLVRMVTKAPMGNGKGCGCNWVYWVGNIEEKCHWIRSTPVL